MGGMFVATALCAVLGRGVPSDVKRPTGRGYNIYEMAFPRAGPADDSEDTDRILDGSGTAGQSPASSDAQRMMLGRFAATTRR